MFSNFHLPRSQINKSDQISLHEVLQSWLHYKHGLSFINLIVQIKGEEKGDV